jgi:hypothetical protein
MQTQRQQLNLYSNETLLFNNNNIDMFKKKMEEHYDYNVEQFDMKENKNGNKCSIVVIRTYTDKFPEQYLSILNTVEGDDNKRTSEATDVLSHTVEIINGQLNETLNGEFNLEEYSVQRNYTNYSPVNACISIYSGNDKSKMAFKWLKNNKAEGRKTDVVFNNGDAYLLFRDQSDEYTIGECYGNKSSKNKKTPVKKENKTVVKKEKNSLNDTKIYTSRELFVNGKKGDVVKGLNGSKLRVAINKETREVFKKVPDNWTEEGHAKFKELFPDGKAINSRKKSTVKKEKKPTVKKEKKPAVKKEKKPAVKKEKKPAVKKEKKPAVKKEKKPAVKKEKKPAVKKEKKPVVSTTENPEDIENITDILDDELDEDLDDDLDDELHEDNNLNDIEETVIESDTDNNSEGEDDEDDSELDIDSTYVNELKEESYVDNTEYIESGDETRLVRTDVETVDFRLQRYSFPEKVGTSTEVCVYLLTDLKDNIIELNKTHRLGEKISSLSLDYPVYTIIKM